MSSARYPIVVIASVMIVMAFVPVIAFGDTPPIYVPRSETGTPTIDGVWTTSQEWAKASETVLNYTDGTHLVIRATHDKDSLYVMLEMPDDYVVDGSAGICFDTKSDGGPYMNSDDYCFVLGNSLGEFHGDGRSNLMYGWPMDSGIFAGRGLSDAKSPYKSSKDHVTYEFEVPIDYLATHSDYGFYALFETRGQTTNYTFNYSWPDFKSESSQRVISPRDWGQVVISPEVNVPEFPVVFMPALAALIGVVAILSRTKPVKSPTD